MVPFTDNFVEGERVSRQTMLDRDAWSIRDALLYQPVERIVRKVPVMRSGRVVAWLVDYRYKVG